MYFRVGILLSLWGRYYCLTFLELSEWVGNVVVLFIEISVYWGVFKGTVCFDNAFYLSK